MITYIVEDVANFTVSFMQYTKVAYLCQKKSSAKHTCYMYILRILCLYIIKKLLTLGREIGTLGAVRI